MYLTRITFTLFTNVENMKLGKLVTNFLITSDGLKSYRMRSIIMSDHKLGLKKGHLPF
jgi:hypothetical protein